jgi:hypothetical protein
MVVYAGTVGLGILSGRCKHQPDLIAFLVHTIKEAVADRCGVRVRISDTILQQYII